jgi:hypothetical protein
VSVDTNPRDATAMKVWDVFYTVMQELYGDTRRRGAGALTHKYRYTFDAIAKWCIENDVDPEDYVRTESSMLTSAGKRLYKPTDLDVPERYTHYSNMRKGNEGGQPEVRWHIQETHLRTMVVRAPDMYPNALDPLTMFDTAFDPWFRVMYPEQPIPRVLQIFGELAWDNLAHNGALRRYVRSVRPATLQVLEQRYGAFAD